MLIATGAEFTEEIKRCVSDNIGKDFCKKLEDLTPHDKKGKESDYSAFNKLLAFMPVFDKLQDIILERTLNKRSPAIFLEKIIAKIGNYILSREVSLGESQVTAKTVLDKYKALRAKHDHSATIKDIIQEGPKTNLRTILSHDAQIRHSEKYIKEPKVKEISR